MKKKISILRILLHGFFLVSANLFSVAIAFVVVQISFLPSDRIIQGSIALLVNLIVYVIVYKIMNGVQKSIMEVDDFSMLSTVFLVSLALLPAVFYPLHFITQGNWSSFENLLAIWPFQMIVNGLCLILNYFIFSKRK